MPSRTCTLTLGATLLLGASCGGGTCPPPKIVAAPPSKLLQSKFSLPLGEDGRKRVGAYLVECDRDEGDGCKDELDSELFCATEKLIDSGSYAKKLMRCDGAVELEVYDAREYRPIKGVALGGWVFAIYMKGVGGDGGPEVLVFPVPTAAPAEE